MSSTVELPLWLAIFIVFLAAIAALNHFFLPAIRWFFRRLVNRVIVDANHHLRLELPTFQLTKRQILIDRLSYDPEIIRQVAKVAEERGVPRDGVMAEVVVYAREMVPAFNAYFYFRIGFWLARKIMKSFYKVSLGYANDQVLNKVPENTSIVFFINHRSNLEYFLVSYLAAHSAAVSYGAGEWARFWPVRPMLRMAGAYIVRRKTGDKLYRTVLRRYIEMATEAGVPHAMFGEGKLSRDGRVNKPKLGLLSYTCSNFDPDGPYDIAFVPVSTNFDRVVEERTLIENQNTDYRGKGVGFVMSEAFSFVGRQVKAMFTGKWHGYGVASANFGKPLYLREWCKDNALKMSELDGDDLFEAVEKLGDELTRRVTSNIPIIGVPVLSLILLDSEGPVEKDMLKTRALNIMSELEEAGGHPGFKPEKRASAINDALKLMQDRELVFFDEKNMVSLNLDEKNLLRYYANSIYQLQVHLGVREREPVGALIAQQENQKVS